MSAPVDRPMLSRRMSRTTGAALLTLVVLSLAAAAIGLLIVRQVATSAQTSGAAAAVDSSRDIAARMVDQVRSELTSDPERVFKQVLDVELPRLCHNGTVYEPGDDWPATCGSSWEYASGSQDVDGVRMMVSAAGAELELTVVATTGPIDAGTVVSLRRVAAADQTLWSLGDVILDDLRPDGDTATVTISGQVYGDRIFLPSDSRVQLGSVQLLSETGIVGTPSSSEDPDLIWRYYVDGPSAEQRNASPPLRDVRDVVAQRPSPSALTAAFTRLAADACPPPALAGGAPTLLPDGASYLCVFPGAQVRLADGSTATIPDDVEAVALRAADDPQHVELVLYERTQVAFDCIIACDLIEMERTAGTNLFADDPDPDQVWQLHRPAYGVVGVRDLETHLQPCGPAFLDPDVGGCAPASADRLPTVVAGTVSEPLDVHVSGPVRGAAATAGQVVVAYWARPLTADAATDRNLTVDLPTFALGVGSDQPIVSLPRRSPPPSPDPDADLSWGRHLEWAGALLTPAGLPGIDNFEQVTFLGQPSAATAVLPSPASRWELVERRDWIPINDCPPTGDGNSDSLPRRCASLIAGS